MLKRVNVGFKQFFRGLAKKHVGKAKKLGITPNKLTVSGCLVCVGAAVVVYFENRNPWLVYWLAAAIFLFGTLLDVADGGLAKATGQETPVGQFLDSNTDRISDGAILVAFLMIFMRQGNSLAVLFSGLALVTCGGVPYVRAKAEAMGIKAKEDILGERLHRLVVIVTGMILAPWLPLQYSVYLLVAVSAYGYADRAIDACKKFVAMHAEAGRK